MPSREEQTVVSFRGWKGGLAADTSEILLSNDKTPDCLNVDFGVNGEVVKRKGFTKWSTADPADMNWGTTIFHFRDSNDNDWLIYVDTDRELYYVNASTGTTLSRAQTAGPTNISVNTAHSAVSFNNAFYISGRNSSINTFKFDGATWTELTDITLDGSGTEFPRGMKLVNAHERVFACNVHTAATSGKDSRIWFSDAGAPETWQSTSWIDVDPDDGTDIRDAILYGERIVIFKDGSFFILAGVDADSFTLFPVSTQVGTTISGRTARSVEGLLVWFDKRTGVWAFNGAEFKTVDQNVNQRILDNLSSTSEFRAYNAWVFNGKYYLSVPWAPDGASNAYASRTFVWDLRFNRWTEYDFAFQSVVDVDGILYGVGLSSGATPTKGVWTLFDADDDAGAAIAAHLETPWFAAKDGFMQEHRLRKLQLYIKGASVSPAALSVDVYADWDDATPIASAVQSANSTNDFVAVEMSGFDALHEAWKVRFYDSSTNPWQVDGLDVLLSSRRMVRGDRE